MFLMQYFCLHCILPFSKSNRAIENTWSTAKCRGRTWYYIILHSYLCNALRKFFLSKSEAINVFPKHIPKSNTRDQSIQARKKLFCHVILKNNLCNVCESFWSKLKAHGGAKSKNRHASLLSCTMEQPPEVLYKKAVLKNFAISTGNTCVGAYLKKKIADL